VPYRLQRAAETVVHVYARSGSYLAASDPRCIIVGGPVTPLGHKYDLLDLISEIMLPAGTVKAMQQPWDVTKVVEVERAGDSVIR
jgi:hypothetical protein